jgi:nitrogen fixation-related uncharacterized protein
MSGLIILLIVMGVMTLLGIAAALWGVDSRDESADPRRPAYPVSIR